MQQDHKFTSGQVGGASSCTEDRCCQKKNTRGGRFFFVVVFFLFSFHHALQEKRGNVDRMVVKSRIRLKCNFVNDVHMLIK